VKNDGERPLQVLIAQEDPKVCRQLLTQLMSARFSVCSCQDRETVSRALAVQPRCLLLLDVAFGGGFPFDLIDQAQLSSAHKVILVSSVYNKTAYKRRPTSLYGADAYLELHHLGDRLVPIIAELFPQLDIAHDGMPCVKPATAERELRQADLRQAALALSRLLLADITLYHQDRLVNGAPKQQTRLVFSDLLAEGRRLLLARLPESEAIADECLQLAFDELYDSFSGRR